MITRIKLAQIIFTPAAQEQAKCMGPEFKNPESVEMLDSGVVVTTTLSDADQANSMFDENDTAIYFYPNDSIARVKVVGDYGGERLL